MPDNLQHMRHVAELANDTAAFTPHAALDISASGARWILMLLPIAERIAAIDDPLIDTGHSYSECRYCGAVRFDGAIPPRMTHAPDCPWVAARALKEGMR